VAVNWSAEADAGIIEAMYMGQLGLEIPALLRTAVLMAQQLRLDKEAISTLLAHYYQVHIFAATVQPPISGGGRSRS
jgi:hypothetical protein